MRFLMLSQYRFLRHELKKQKKLIAVCCLILFLQSLLLVLFPLPVRFALDHALTPGAKAADVIQILNFEWSRMEVLVIASLGSLLIGLLMTAFEFLDERFTNQSILKLVNNVRLGLLNDLLTRKFAYLEGKLKVDVLGRLSGDVHNLELFVSTTLVILCRSLPSLLFAVASMFIINTQFALLMLLLIPAFYTAITVISKKIKHYEKEHRSKTNLFEHEALQALSAISLLKSLLGEKEALSQLEKRQQQINQSFRKSKFFTALLNATFSGSRHSIRALVLLLGGLAILDGNLTLGSLFAFVSYLEALNRPVGEIANFISRYGKASASLERVQELVQELSQHPEKDGVRPLRHLEASTSSLVEFQNVSFAYQNGPLLFADFDLKISRKKMIALVGPSGAGKSTFIKFFNRLNDPTSGAISLTGVPVRDIQLKDLRRHICLISQDPFFLSGSVRDNLTLALTENVGDDRLWTALEKVNAAGFVRDLSQGLDTLIGEAGVQLSGGQSKRLSLARAFLRSDSASIFIFDEPTSGLDPVSATHVMGSLRELAHGKELVLFSTHRVREFETADEILFFQKNQSPQAGTHTALMAENLLYRQLIQKDSHEAEV